MTTAILATLDQSELFQLALKAGSGGDSGSAIAYLKEAVSRPDATAQAHYMLGAEYAQIQLYERAIGELEAALALDPALATARLQLGLLWLGADNGQRAADVLQLLVEPGVPETLQHFGAGLLQLLSGDLGQARQSLQQGVALNIVNPALNADMQSILGEIERRMAGGVPTAPAAPAPDIEPEDGGQRHVLLSAYAGNGSH